MIMIDRVYQTIKMLANTDGRGNVKPSDFDKAVFNVITEKIEEYPFDLNRWQNRENRGLVGNGVENLPAIIQEKMNYFLKTEPLVFASGKFTLPTDVRYIDSIFYKNTNEVASCKNAKEFNHLKKFIHTQPSTTYPIGFKVENKIEILPATIATDVSVYYLRQPKVPKWTYVVINGTELFNPAAGDFQDIDIHPSEEDDVVARLCVKFGLNLKEPDLAAAGTTEETQEFNKQNSN